MGFVRRTMLKYCHQSCLRISTLLLVLILIGCDLAVISRQHFPKPKLQQGRLPRPREQLLFLRQQEPRDVWRTTYHNKEFTIVNHFNKTTKNRNNFKRKKYTDSQRILDKRDTLTSTSKLFVSLAEQKYSPQQVSKIRSRCEVQRRKKRTSYLDTKNLPHNYSDRGGGRIYTNCFPRTLQRKVWQKQWTRISLKDQQGSHRLKDHRVVVPYKVSAEPVPIHLSKQLCKTRQFSPTGVCDQAQGAQTPMSASRIAPIL